MNEVVRALQTSNPYSHTTGPIEVIETHLSWIFLTGEFAYKLKKPLKLPFVDFSTLERRAHYCLEEVRLNRQYTDALYIGALPVVRTADGVILVTEPPVEEGATVVDWVVKMHQFEQSCQADHLVANKAVGADHFFAFGTRLAQQHAAVESASNPGSISKAARENFTTLQSLTCISPEQKQIERLHLVMQEQFSRWGDLLLERQLNGYVRECHGDLHLANIMLHHDQLQAFDCVEFNRELREVDVWNDVAFLVMDCCVRAREDLAYSFVDGYLNTSGDYEGAVLLNFYGQYRSMVRAKVAAIALEQSSGVDRSARDRLHLHLDWAEGRANAKPGRLLVCCGLSGSGKSYWSAQLVPKLAAIRLRSDIFRKVSAGLAAGDNSASGIGSGLYSPQSSTALYSEMTQLASHLLQQGENVIIDATCLTIEQRSRFLAAAKEIGSESVVLHLTAPDAVLRERIVQRKHQGDDPSEADLSVLEWQQQKQEIPQLPEPVLVADTSVIDLQDLVDMVNEAYPRTR